MRECYGSQYQQNYGQNQLPIHIADDFRIDEQAVKKSRTANDALTRQKIVAAKRNFAQGKQEVGNCFSSEESESEMIHNTAEAAFIKR